MKIILAFLFISCLFPLNLWGACPGADCSITTCTDGEAGVCRLVADCSESAVQNTINASSGGDGVYLPTCTKTTWSGTVVIGTGKKLHVRGNGSENTVINGTLQFECTADNPVEISHMQFIEAARAINVYGTCAGIKIHDNHFKDISGTVIYFWGRNLNTGQYGIVYKNEFSGNYPSTVAVYVEGSSDASLWTPDTLGTQNAVYIEGNYVHFDNIGTPGTYAITDGVMAARLVVRFNTIENMWVATHGDWHALGGTVLYEYYNNSLLLHGTYENPYFFYVYHHGSGEGMFFNNTWDLTYTSGPEWYYPLQVRGARDWFTEGPPYCNGDSDSIAFGDTKFGDTTISTDPAYPCKYQAGTNYKAGSTKIQPSPMYFWNNYWGSSRPGVRVDVETNSSGYFINNRDFYQSTGVQTSASSPFDGTSGMGFGTVANRPTSCNAGGETIGGRTTYTGQGVGYYATDEKKLYRCSSPDTWTVQYQPLTCPHPLAGSGICDYDTIGYTGYTLGGADTDPPSMSSALPSGSQMCTSNPRNVTLQLTATDSSTPVTCKYDTSDVTYATMANTYGTVVGTTHSQVVSLACNASYTYYSRCQDSVPNTNTSSVTTSFSIAAPVPFKAIPAVRFQ